MVSTHTIGVRVSKEDATFLTAIRDEMSPGNNEVQAGKLGAEHDEIVRQYADVARAEIGSFVITYHRYDYVTDTVIFNLIPGVLK